MNKAKLSSIADYVSDRRAPTPSAAAEIAVSEYREIENYMLEKRQQLQRYFMQKLRMEKVKIEQYRLKLGFLHPRARLETQKQRMIELEQHLRQRMENALVQAKQRLALTAERMRGNSPVDRLAKGYSFVTDETGQNIKSVDRLKQKDVLTIHMTDGFVKTEVTKIVREDR